MEKTKWLWKKKFSDRTPAETESSGSLSSQSGRLTDDLDSSKESPSDNAYSPEVMSKVNGREEEVDETITVLTEKLSAALVNISAKDDLVKQHSKVAEEAVAGWEKADNEVLALKKQVASLLQQKLVLEDRVSHLDGALKECVRQLRLAREDQEEKIHESVAEKIQQFESAKLELENQLLEAKIKVDTLSEVPPKIDTDVLNKIDFLEQENASLTIELHSLSEELELRTIERDLSTHAAETASKQQLESINKVAKLEAECRGLRFMLGKFSLPSDQKTYSASSFYVDSFTDSQSDTGERLAALNLDDSLKCRQRLSDSWAQPSMAGTGKIKDSRNSVIDIDLMDDFIEMEKLAALPETVNGAEHYEREVAVNEFCELETSLRNEMDSMAHKISELDEGLHNLEAEKLKLEQQLMKSDADKVEVERALSIAREANEKSQLLLNETEHEVNELRAKLASAIESKQLLESQLTRMEGDCRDMSHKINTLEGEVQTMSEKIISLVAEVERERAFSMEVAVKYEQLHEELSQASQDAELRQIAKSSNLPKINQEDLAVAANKLAECQKTILSLGNQLKSLATLEDFLIDTASIPAFSEKASHLSEATAETLKLNPADTLSERTDSTSTVASKDIGLVANKKEHRSAQSSSSGLLTNHVCSDKNRNGFAKFFSRSKNGIQLEI